MGGNGGGGGPLFTFSVEFIAVLLVTVEGVGVAFADWGCEEDVTDIVVGRFGKYIK